MGLPWRLSSEESACNAGDTGDSGSIPGSGRSPGIGDGNPLQSSHLENSMGRGAWWAAIHGATKNCTQSMHIQREDKDNISGFGNHTAINKRGKKRKICFY